GIYSFIARFDWIAADESEDTSDSKLEYNSDFISVTPFESSTLYNEYSTSSPNLECTTSLYTSESSFSSEQFNLDNSENLTSPSDSFTYSDSSNVKNTKKHKSVFAISSNKKPKPGKNEIIGPCEETFALLTSTSTLRAHLCTVHRLSEKGSLLPLSGTSKQPIFKKPIHVAQNDPTQPTLLDTITKLSSLSSKRKDRLTSRLLAWLIDDMLAFNIMENDKFHDFVYEAESHYQIPYQETLKKTFII
ncbi:23503_t:CDS:2, partial [Gigaspora rosea]